MSKFAHLAIGQRFRFEGALYQKTTVLKARNETTGQERFIPRSAVLVVEDGATTAAPPPRAARTLDSGEVERAMRALHARSIAALAPLAERIDAALLEAVRCELIAAQRACDAALNLGDATSG